MDILLIDPPYITLKGVPIDTGYNMGITSLAAYLRRGGFETAVLMGDLLMDLPSTNLWLTMNIKKFAEGQRTYEAIIRDRDHFIWQKLRDRVRRSRPRAVGISYLTPLKCVVERIAELVREVDRDIKVIAGSFHPTFCPEEVMRHPDIDFAVAGEGETPLLALAGEMRKDRPAWETVPGIYYRDREGNVRHTPPAQPVSDLDGLPFPARDLVLDCDYDRYRVHSVSTARGCPYTCTFCSDRELWGGRVRRRGVDSVIEELEMLKKTYRIKYVDVVDGTFTYDRRYVRAFCEALVGRKLGLRWRCTARYDNLDEGLLRLMKQAGCDGLYFGLESGSERMLKLMDKKITVDDIVKVSEMVYKSRIPSGTAILLGLPGESREDMAATLKMMRSIKTDIFDVNIYTPLPGTPLYEAMSPEARDGIDWGKVGYKSFDTCFSGEVSLPDFERYRTEAYEIADSVRKKTIVRFVARKFFPFA